MTTIDDAMKRIREAATHLNEQSDTLSKSISTIDEALSKLNLGVEIWFTDEPLVSKSGESVYLGYGRYKDRWCLLVKSEKTKDSEPKSPFFNERFDDMVKVAFSGFGAPTTHPLVEGKRELKMAAVDLIPKLFIKIADVVEQIGKTVAEKTIKAQEILSTLE